VTVRSIRWVAVAVALTALTLIRPVARGDGDAAQVAQDVLEIQDLELLASDLPSPSDVAIGPDGTVYVLCAHDEQVVVLGEGNARSSLPVTAHAVGLAYGSGRLWIPRTDQPAVLVLDPLTGEREVRQVDAAPLGTRLTDAVIQGDSVVVFANHGGPWVAPVEGGAFEPLPLDLDGGMPFLAALTRDGDLAVTDVQEDRVLVFDEDSGQPTFVGKWGVWEGTFVHPTGLATDRRGRFFVADGFTGVVQVFDDEGTFLGALGRDGELMRLTHPMGVAVREDVLVVVDGNQGRALRMRVESRTRPVSPQGMYDRKVPRLSYLEGTSSPHTLMAPVCETCHDGSVRSSAHVWDPRLHQHPVDRVPQKSIPQPFTVDEEGRLYCGTCHMPHRMGSAADLPPEEMEVFLKEPRARSQLCLACHTDVVAEVREIAGPIPEDEAGHLVGEVHRTVARRGAAAIAAEVESVECLDCHAPHGAVGDMLLSADAAASGGCTRCHVGVSVEHGANTHPVNRPLTDPAAIRALEARGVFLAPDDSVSCLTCHDVHSSGEDSWLTASMSADERCVVCHRAQSSLQGSGHDLRKKGGQHLATACLGCHTLHEATGPALGRTGGDLRDPTGCQSCHAEGGVARESIIPDAGHPLFDRNPSPGKLPAVGSAGTLPLGEPGSSSCLTCHDPHARSSGSVNTAMLRKPGGDAETCLACHDEMRTALGSDHDLRLTDSSLSRQRQEPMEAGGFCLACHGMHDAGDWQGWGARTGGPSSASNASRACLGCHEQGNPAGGTVVAVWDHPTDLLLTSAKVPWHNTGELPLYDDAGRPTDDKQIGQITCLTCHDPHVWSPKHGGQGGTGEGDTRNSFLRPGWEGFCSGCHGEEALAVYRYFHDQGYREEMEQRSQRRDWPIYQEENR
jgi:predicted CXXCH cytochrome family protein